MPTQKTYTKLDDHTLQIEQTTTETDVTTSNFTYNSLVSARDNLVVQKQQSSDNFDVQIADAQATIDEADSLGITSE